jgi:HD-like signal output (HDOD) protein
VSSLTVSPTYYRDKALRTLGELAPCSPVLNKLLATLSYEDVSFAQLAEIIEKDTVLAGNVLRLVNSALYGRRGTISSVRHAISLIGLVKLRNTAMTLSMAAMWNRPAAPEGWSAVRFNLHATAVAIVADLVAQRIPVVYPEGAFAAGLLHDVGLLLVVTALPEEFRQIRRRYLDGGGTLEECEQDVLGISHTELSAAALVAWNLPEPIQKAVRHRCHPQAQAGPELPLSRLLEVADRVADAEGLTALDILQPPQHSAQAILAEIGAAELAPALLEEFHAEFEPIRSFF